MLVAGLAKTVGMTPDAVRHYVKYGLLIPDRNPENGYQRFDQRHVQKLHFIRSCKELGFGLKDIALIFEHADLGESPCPQVREIMQIKLQEMAKKLADLQKTYDQMLVAVQKWEYLPDCQPTGEHICHLIEGYHDEDCCGSSDYPVSNGGEA